MTAYIGTGLKVSIGPEMTTDELIAALRAADEEIGILRTEKHGDAEGIMNLQNALRIAEADRDNSYARGLSAGWRLCSIRTEAMIAALRAECEARERAEAMVAAAYQDAASVAGKAKTTHKANAAQGEPGHGIEDRMAATAEAIEAAIRAMKGGA